MFSGFGEHLEVELSLPSFEIEAVKARSDSKGSIVSKEVTGRSGAKASLVAQHFDFEESTYSVCLKVDRPDNVLSFETSFEMVEYDSTGARLDSARGDVSFHGPWWGHRFNIPNPSVKKTVRADVYITDVIFQADSKERSNQNILCSHLEQADEEIGETFSKRLSAVLFLSASMHRKIEQQIAKRKGLEGMPGTVSPYAMLDIVQSLNANTLPEIVDPYLNKVKSLIVERAKPIFRSHFQQFPVLWNMLHSAIDEVWRELHQNAKKNVEMLLAWEDQIITRNHYFMDTVQSLRHKVYHTLDEDGDGMSQSFMDFIRGLSNESQRVADTQIELFAYYKVMRKRLCDYVIMSARHNMGVVPIKNKDLVARLRIAVSQSFGCNEKGYQFLMRRSEGQQSEIDSLRERLQLLRQAHEAVVEATKEINVQTQKPIK
eukprot:GHVN01032884.1.p1 GENE.GHVN01032884.1~~GHVN01032884.1.p1  ORF type:complete len:431 (-),score=61.85 GHVN01032884.1:265-1557(-)